MSITTRTGIEAGLALGSIAVGLAGAALVEPIVLGVAAVGAVVATVMRLSDKSHELNSTGTGSR
jgi:hypothetical protein